MNYRKKAIFVVMAMLCLNFSSAFAQAVSLKMEEVSVKEAMTQLKNKSGYSFVYEVGDLDTKRKVNVNATQLLDAVSQILEGQNVSFEIRDKNIVVSKMRRMLLRVRKNDKGDSERYQRRTDYWCNSNDKRNIQWYNNRL